MIVQSLHIYPIKSLGGISLTSSKLTSRGLFLDRRYMLVDESFKFLTQREYAAMALFDLELKADILTVMFKKQYEDKISFSIKEVGKPLNNSVQVWESIVDARHISDELDDWFSTRLQKKCQLVFMGDDNIRPVKPKYIKNEIVSFADGYPYLLTNTSSLELLNNKMETSVEMDRFRANIVIKGNNPFEEDEWTNLKIGNHQFVTPKKCARCQVVNIDPKTGLSSKEVLKTLSTFRKVENKVLFGMNGCWMNKKEENAVIRVGDEVVLSVPN